jgi:hypothetical protein
MSAEAAERFRELVAQGDEIPYDVRESGNGSPLPQYIPLTERFVRDQASALAELDSFGSGCAAIESAGLAAPYLEELRIAVPGDARKRAELAGIVFLCRLWTGSTDFSLDAERLHDAIAELEAGGEAGGARVRDGGGDGGQIGSSVDVAVDGRGDDVEAKGAKATFLGEARRRSAHGHAPEHGRWIGVPQADDPPSAVGGMAEHGRPPGSVQPAEQLVEFRRRHLGGIHADLESRPSGRRPGRGQAFVESVPPLGDHLETTGKPGPPGAVEGDDLALGRAGGHCLQCVGQGSGGHRGRLLRRARWAQPRLHPPGDG